MTEIMFKGGLTIGGISLQRSTVGIFFNNSNYIKYSDGKVKVINEGTEEIVNIMEKLKSVINTDGNRLMKAEESIHKTDRKISVELSSTLSDHQKAQMTSSLNQGKQENKTNHAATVEMMQRQGGSINK